MDVIEAEADKIAIAFGHPTMKEFYNQEIVALPSNIKSNQDFRSWVRSFKKEKSLPSEALKTV